MDTFTAFQGRDAGFVAQLVAEGGAAYTGYSGTEPITANFWAGNETSPIAGVATATWASAAAGTVDVAIAGSNTGALVPGTYDVELVIGNVTVWRAFINLESSPGNSAGRTAKVTLRHLRKHYRRVDKLLASADFSDDPTALEARADAWDWFQDLLHRHYRGGGWIGGDYSFGPLITMGLYGPGYYRSGRRSKHLQDWLDAGRLDLTTSVLDAMALYALSQILGGMVALEGKGGYGELACQFAVRAETLVATITAEIDSDGDGVNDRVIRLDVADTLEG
jgi:hypothetical protein